MAELAPGAEATIDLRVEAQNCTVRGDHRIFSTPELVLLLELTAIKALEPFLQAERSSVGTKIDVAHSAPTLLGQTVRCTATVTEVDRRRVTFSIMARDEIDTIATGTHERFIVDLEKFGARLDEKASAARAATEQA